MSESCVRPPDSTSTATSTPTTPPTTPAPGTAYMGSLLEKLKRNVSLDSLGKNLLTSKLKNLSTYSPQTNLKPSTPKPYTQTPPQEFESQQPCAPNLKSNTLPFSCRARSLVPSSFEAVAMERLLYSDAYCINTNNNENLSKNDDNIISRTIE